MVKKGLECWTCEETENAGFVLPGEEKALEESYRHVSPNLRGEWYLVKEQGTQTEIQEIWLECNKKLRNFLFVCFSLLLVSWFWLIKS